MRLLSWALWVVMMVAAVGAFSHRPMLIIAVAALVAGLAVDRRRGAL
jgi:hypothetical protein